MVRKQWLWKNSGVRWCISAWDGGGSRGNREEIVTCPTSHVFIRTTHYTFFCSLIFISTSGAHNLLWNTEWGVFNRSLSCSPCAGNKEKLIDEQCQLPNFQGSSHRCLFEKCTCLSSFIYKLPFMYFWHFTVSWLGRKWASQGVILNWIDCQIALTEELQQKRGPHSSLAFYVHVEFFFPCFQIKSLLVLAS